MYLLILSQSIPNIEYNIYGKGDNLSSSQIYYLADRLGISDVINIKGTLSNDEMRKELISNNYILQLSLSESLGVAILEAIQHGLVPIVSKIGGIQDIVENNLTGIIEHYYKIDKILSSFLKLNKNPLKYSLMSEACSKFVDEKFDNSIESMIQHFEAVGNIEDDISNKTNMKKIKTLRTKLKATIKKVKA